jgi:LPXTG-motif cell wall-anchored protein
VFARKATLPKTGDAILAAVVVLIFVLILLAKYRWQLT